MKKKIIVVFLIVCISLMLIGCGKVNVGNNVQDNDNKKLKVMVLIYLLK